MSLLSEAIERCELSSGCCVSFHHHLRNGDAVLSMVIAEIAARGLRGIHVAASSIFPVLAPLVQHIRNGTVTKITSSYIVGPVASAISRGDLPMLTVLQTHGGRARSMECGDLVVDAAFMAAPTCDDYGNMSGAAGRAACGVLGYAQTDVTYARRVSP